MKTTVTRLDNDTIYLQILTIENYEDKYLQWMNNPQIHQYTSKKKYTKKELLEYIDSFYKNDTSYLFGIYKNDNTYIGNIKLDNIDIDKKIADIGIIIGDINEWGKGYASEAIKLLSEFSFNKLKLHTILAGMSKSNLGSLRSFLKNDFIKADIYTNFIDYYLVRKTKLNFIGEKMEDVTNKVLDIFVNTLEVKDITLLSTRENTPKWDSFSNIEIISNIEEIFDIEFDIEEIIEFNSVEDIINNIQEKKGKINAN